MKKIILLIFVLSKSLKAQIIDFKIKVETEKYTSYSNVKLDEMICKGDSIFGYNKDDGHFFSSFDKGITFNSVNTKNMGATIDFMSNQNYNYGKSIFFLKGKDIVIYANKKYFISKDWRNFSSINNKSKSDFPSIIKQLEDNDENYGLENTQILDDKFILTFCSYLGVNYKVFYSKDLINWNEIQKPNNLRIVGNGIKFYKNSLYLFTWDDKKKKSVVHTSSDFGKNWETINEFEFKFENDYDSFRNIIFFNDKIFYENLYKPFVYDIKTKITMALNLSNGWVRFPKTNNDFLYFTNDNLIKIYKDSLTTLNIDYSFIKNQFKLNDALITDNFIIINGEKAFLTKSISSEDTWKLYKRNEDSKFVIAKELPTTNYQYLNKYDIILYADELKNYKYNIKRFKNTISNNSSILSLTFGFPSNGFMNSYGNHLFSTNKNEGTSNASFDNLISYYQQKQIGIFNGNQVKNNTMYFTYHGKDRIEINELTLLDNNVKPINKRYNLPYEFELKNNENIETYKLNGLTVGNEISAFLGMSLYSLKTFLFIYDYKKNTNSNYRKIDLTKVTSLIDNTVGKAGKNICLNFRGSKDGAILNFNIYSISSIIQNENYIYIFLVSEKMDWVLPICIDKSNYSVTLKNNSFFNIGNFEYNRTMEEATNTGGYQYLPFSKEFINHYKQENNNKLDVYNKNMDKVWSTVVNDIDIKHINEVENYLIIGGSTKNSGYKGFSNPKVIVIDKITRKICYSKVIPKKYASVQSVKLDSDRNVIFSIGTSDVTDISFNPLVIIDKLDKNGKFVNDLFTNQ
jgi:hypothetical protein